MLFIVNFIGCGGNNKTNNEEPLEQKEEENQEPEEIETPEEIEKTPGSLYIHYVFNYDKEDIIEKVESIDGYEILEPTRTGYSFESWFTDEDFDDELELSKLVMPTDEHNIIVFAYANWIIERYRVKFYCDDALIMSKIVTYGEKVDEPMATVKAGYIFTGWDKDSSYVTEDMNINAIYEKNNNCSNIMVILGNWMNNDGTISTTMRKRLELALKAYSEMKIDYIVVSGGMANSAAGISEADAMYDYLTSHGISSSIIIKEDKSMSTEQNAIYTMAKLEDVDFSNLIIVSTIEHFVNYQTIKYFNNAALNNTKIKNKNINIMIYTNNANC